MTKPTKTTEPTEPTEQTAYSEDTPTHPATPGISHLPRIDYPVDASPVGEVLTGKDGERQEIAPRADGLAIKLDLGQRE